MSYRCRNCGEQIDMIQANDFNSLCPECVRLQRSTAPLEALAKSTAESTAQNYLGMMLGGVVATIVGIRIIILLSMQDTTREHVPVFVYVPIGGLACLLGIGGFIVGLIMYRGASQ